LESRRAEQILPGWTGTSGRGRRWGNGEGQWIWCKYCGHMYVNGKITSVETIPGMEGWRRMVEGVNSSTIYLMHYKNFYKCHNVHPPGKTIKNSHCFVKIKAAFQKSLTFPHKWCKILLSTIIDAPEFAKFWSLPSRNMQHF
jgi:hypothetical protein